MAHHTNDAELRFSVSAWRCYHVAVLAMLTGATVAAGAAEALSLWGGRALRLAVAYQLILGCIAVALAATTLLAVLANLWEATRTWLRWRQLRQPVAVVSRDGILYQPRGREVAFSWRDIERLELHQYHYGRRAVASVSLRLTPSAAERERIATRPRIPSQRTLGVGNLDQIDVPTSAAVAILRRLAGSRFATHS